MRKFDKVSARLGFSPRRSRQLLKMPLMLMYHETTSIFLGSKKVLNLVYFWLNIFSGSKMSQI